MNQFIPYFLGQATPPYPRAVTVAEVLPRERHRERRPRRAAPDVLRDARQLLVRRLLQGRGDRRGRTSSITEGFGIDHDLLWVTVFDDDEEAAAAWVDAVGIAPERIVRRGRLDEEGELANYWYTHAAGPGRSVLGDLRRPRPEVRARRRARRRRGALHGDLEPGVHAGPGRRAT